MSLPGRKDRASNFASEKLHLATVLEQLFVALLHQCFCATLFFPILWRFKASLYTCSVPLPLMKTLPCTDDQSTYREKAKGYRALNGTSYAWNPRTCLSQIFLGFSSKSGSHPSHLTSRVLQGYFISSETQACCKDHSCCQEVHQPMHYDTIRKSDVSPKNFQPSADVRIIYKSSARSVLRCSAPHGCTQRNDGCNHNIRMAVQKVYVAANSREYEE